MCARSPRLGDEGVGLLIQMSGVPPPTPLTQPAPDTRSQLLVLSKNNVTQSRSWAGPREGQTSGDLTFQSLSIPTWTGTKIQSKISVFHIPPEPSGLAGPAQLSLLTFLTPHMTPSAPGSSDLSQKPVRLPASARAARSHRNARSKADLCSHAEQPAAEPRLASRTGRLPSPAPECRVARAQ